MGGTKSQATLLKPPPPLPDSAPIENLLRLHHLTDICPTSYTNAYPLWHPPGARGIFGGAVAAQSLAAAQASVAPDFVAHSMHCYFLTAGDSEIPIIYEVEKVRDGRSFVTRTVQACQRGKCVFTTTVSFKRPESGDVRPLEHQGSMPTDVEVPSEEAGGLQEGAMEGSDKSGPFEVLRSKIVKGRPGRTDERSPRQWIRARGRISDGPAASDATGAVRHGNHVAHLSALAYASDFYFLGTLGRVHGLMVGPVMKESIDHAVKTFKGSNEAKEQLRAHLEKIAKDEADETATFGSEDGPPREIGMLVSLDHSIFFHNPQNFRADEWILAEMWSPWAGEGRGLVMQRLWSREGVLIATCIQEGLIRMRNKKEAKL